MTSTADRPEPRPTPEPPETTPTPEPPGTGPTRWGVLGTGLIAAMFATDLALLPDARLVAVGSRTQQRAAQFAAELGGPDGGVRGHASYAELVADPDVDAVYVATPHPSHRADALLAIQAGKAVLCEKPFTMTAAEARELADAARARGTFLMEAMWTRFLPHIRKVGELLAAGAIGEVRAVYADHGQWFERSAEHRLFAPELGGGALLDLGIYPVSFASMVLGPPAKVTAVSDQAFTGVDAQTSILLQHEGGAQAVLTCTLEAVSPVTAAIVGTEARIEIDRTWYAPTTFRLVTRDGRVTEYAEECAPRGMQYEAAEVGRCLREGRLESDVLPLAETVSIMETMDEVRRQIGLTYPGE